MTLSEKEIKKDLQDCKERWDVFSRGQYITSPTLLINAKFTTHSRLLRFLRLSEMLPINHFVRLRLYFKNLYDAEINSKEVGFGIEYPNGKQFRRWPINIPQINKKDECYWSEIDILFKPEIPGVHRLVIDNLDGVQYADYHGLFSRPYKQMDEKWTSSFYIYTTLELRLYLVAFLALLISTISLCFNSDLISIIQSFVYFIFKS